MGSLQLVLAISLFTPLITGLAVLLFNNSKNMRDICGPIGGIITFASAIAIAMAIIDGQTISINLWQIVPGIGVSFNVTALGALFGIVASGLWILASIYSVGYMRGSKEKNQTRFNFYYAVAIHAAMAISYSGNLLMLFIFYEVLTFSTYPLVTHGQTKDAKDAGRLYMGILVATSLLLFLPALLWVWIISGTLDFTKGGIIPIDFSPSLLPILLAMFAFGIGKAALMPIHRWLPAAMVAPTPVSALLHAVAVVKAGVFSFLTIIVYIFGIDFLAESGAAVWLVWLAAFTILTSSIIAITKDDLKARLAYSTISQLSYILLGAALATQAAIEGAALHIVMHATAKITLFFCAGAIYVNAHIKKISELDGLGPKMPLVFIAFFVASLSIIGLPPLGGSWSKFMLMVGSVDAGIPLMLLVLGISSLLNIYYLLEPCTRAFFKPSLKEFHVDNHILTIFPPGNYCNLKLTFVFCSGLGKTSYNSNGDTMSNLNQSLKKMGNYASVSLVIIGICLIISEFFVHRHGEIKLEDFPVFPVIYGFSASVFIVVVGIGLRYLLMRKEDYYD